MHGAKRVETGGDAVVRCWALGMKVVAVITLITLMVGVLNAFRRIHEHAKKLKKSCYE